MSQSVSYIFTPESILVDIILHSHCAAREFLDVTVTGIEGLMVNLEQVMVVLIAS